MNRKKYVLYIRCFCFQIYSTKCRVRVLKKAAIQVQKLHHRMIIRMHRWMKVKVVESKQHAMSKPPKPPIEIKREFKQKQIHRQLQCENCNLEFSTKKNLNRHLKLHKENNEVLQCNECKRTYQNEWNFKVHITRRHKEAPLGISWTKIIQKPKLR